MTAKRTRILQWTALLACLLIAAQMATILIRGGALCLNQGCEIVEALTTVPALYFNLAGLLYFLAILVGSRSFATRDRSRFDWLRLLLLAGLAAEGVLINYQLFVAQTFCSYCLLIFAIIVLLNLISGWRQTLLGLAVFLAMFAAFGALNFGAARILIQKQNLRAGTFATRSSATPGKELFLLFSSDCSHCRNVLAAIEGADNCEINFNPIDRIEALALPGLTYVPGYNPALNRLLLSLLEIKSIPVLLAKDQEGLAFIKGEGAITNYINQTCFAAPLWPESGATSANETITPLWPESGAASDNATIGFSEATTIEGECEIEVACPDQLEQSTTSAY